MDRRRDRQTETGRQTERRGQRQRETDTDRQTETETDRQTERIIGLGQGEIQEHSKLSQ